MRALITSTGERLRRLWLRSPIGGSFERRTAAGLSRPGTLVASSVPGLKPSARLRSVGSIGLPALLRGIERRLRLTCRPVSLPLSRLVKRSFGHG